MGFFHKWTVDICMWITSWRKSVVTATNKPAINNTQLLILTSIKRFVAAGYSGTPGTSYLVPAVRISYLPIPPAY